MQFEDANKIGLKPVWIGWILSSLTAWCLVLLQLGLFSWNWSTVFFLIASQVYVLMLTSPTLVVRRFLSIERSLVAWIAVGALTGLLYGVLFLELLTNPMLAAEDTPTMAAEDVSIFAGAGSGAGAVWWLVERKMRQR
ncbi:MAG: hypothetical protein AAF590_02720 [Pseudomonadota bacterium]